MTGAEARSSRSRLKVVGFDWTSIVTAVVSALSGGGLVGLLNAKEAKRKARLENDNSAAEAWRNLYERADKECNETKEEVRALREENRQMHEKINDLVAKVTAANLQKCDVNGCDNRKPPRGW